MDRHACFHRDDRAQITREIEEGQIWSIQPVVRIFSSLYQAVGGKRQLFKHCLARYHERVSTDLWACLQRASTGRRFITEVFEAVTATGEKHEGAKRCLLANSANEFGQRDTGFHSPWLEDFEGLGRIFKEALRRAQSEGNVSTRRMSMRWPPI